MQRMTQAPQDPESQFSELLAQFDEALAKASETSSLATLPYTSTLTDPSLQRRFDKVHNCLQLLEQDRRRNIVSAEKDKSAQEQPAVPHQIGRFRVIRRLGSGGFGVVFLAEDPVLRRRVAIKMPLASIFQSQELHDRFLRECRAAAMLNHPGVVRVLESGDIQGIPYQVAEFVDGERLSDLLRRERPSVKWSAKIVRSLADAVQHAHEHGVLHRDIKPDNILLQTQHAAEGRESVSRNALASGSPDNSPELTTEAGAFRLINATQSSDAVPRITDFGLARLVDDDAALSRSGMLVGTAKYMSPEQLHGKIREQGPPTDIYALGVVLHELLTGGVPFADAESLQSRIVISGNSVPSFRFNNAGISKDLETICLKCLQLRPEDRYASAGEFRDDLSRYLDGRPTLARPVPVHEQLLRWVSKNQKLAGLLGLLMLSVSVVLVQAVLNDRTSREQNKVLSSTLSQLTAEKQRADESLMLADRNRATAEQSESRYRNTAWIAQQGEYSAAVMQAASLWQSGEIAQMNQTIQPFLPRLESDLPGFEWRYLWHQGQTLRQLRGHSDYVDALSISADHEQLYTMGRDNTIRRWNARTGLLESTLRLEGQVHHFEASVSRDCPRAVILRMVKSEQIDDVTVYDLSTGKIEMRRTFPFSHIGGVAISHDGNTVLIGGHKKDETESFRPFIQVWFPRTDTVIEDKVTFREMAVGDATVSGHTITEVGFVADGKGVVISAMAVSSPPLSQLFLTTLNDVSTKHPGESNSVFGALAPLGWHQGIVHKMKYSPDESHLATTVLGDGDSYWADVWDLKKQALVRRSEIFRRTIDSISFDASGKNLALGLTLSGSTSDGTPAESGQQAVSRAESELRLWDFAADTTQTLAYQAERDIKFLKPLNVASNKGWFVGEGGGAISMWQPGSVLPHRQLTGHRPKEVWDLAFSPDGATVFSVGDDHLLRSWNLASGAEKRSADSRTMLVSCVDVSPDGRWVAAGGYDDEVVVYDAQALGVVATLKGHTNDLRALAFAPDSRMLASSGRDKVIRIWNVPGFDLAGVREGHNDTVRALAWTQDGQLISSGSDQKILAWDPAGNIVLERLEPEGVHSLDFAPAGLRLPVPSTNAAVSERNLDPRTKLRPGSMQADPRDIITVQPDELIALGMKHGTVRLWHLPTDTVLFDAQHHGVEIRSLAFSPDGRTLAVAGSDEAVYLWHVATGRNVLTFDQLGSSVHRVIFSPDGTQLIAALHDGTIRIWHAPPAL
jgi:WD40 repeat protein/serine/threonine protein kinase